MMSIHSISSVSRLRRGSLTIGGGLLAGLAVLSGTASATEARKPRHTAHGPCYGALTLPGAYAALLDTWHPPSLRFLDDPASRRAFSAPLAGVRRPVALLRMRAEHRRVLLALPWEACVSHHPLTTALTRAGIRDIGHRPAIRAAALPTAPAIGSAADPRSGHPAPQKIRIITPSHNRPESLTPKPPRAGNLKSDAPTPKSPTPTKPTPTKPTANRPTSPAPIVPGTTDPAAEASTTRSRRTKNPKLPTPTTKGAVAAAAALERLGTPFSWGGGSPAGPTRGIGRGASTTGFDCSGLTLYAWSKAGVKLGHYTGTQFRQGRRVPTRELRKGDLVFFGGGTGNPTHVGLYLGDGVMIHAPKTGDVVRRTSFLDSPYYRPIYRGAVRPG
jgi:cell wall-associated NlpC family hydrolase